MAIAIDLLLSCALPVLPLCCISPGAGTAGLFKDRLFIKLDLLLSSPRAVLLGEALLGVRWRPALMVAAACREDKGGERGEGGLGRKTSPLVREIRRGRCCSGELDSEGVRELGSELRSGDMLAGARRCPDRVSVRRCSKGEQRSSDWSTKRLHRTKPELLGVGDVVHLSRSIQLVTEAPTGRVGDALHCIALHYMNYYARKPHVASPGHQYVTSSSWVGDSSLHCTILPHHSRVALTPAIGTCDLSRSR